MRPSTLDQLHEKYGRGVAGIVVRKTGIRRQSIYVGEVFMNHDEALKLVRLILGTIRSEETKNAEALDESLGVYATGVDATPVEIGGVMATSPQSLLIADRIKAEAVSAIRRLAAASRPRTRQPRRPPKRKRA